VRIFTRVFARMKPRRHGNIAICETQKRGHQYLKVLVVG
jgi:hypothetical protein